ncbi:MAG: hypothetical protein LC659_12005 [Myxococcales bacterium]|nr:hypothetical protein [Myxococcales bacterium]
MHIVALTALGTPVDAAAAALAAALGTTAYEERLKLAVGLPSVVATTPDAARAASLAAALAAHGHRALACASADVIGAAEMVSLRRFALDDDALVAADRGERLPWSDIAVLVRAIDRRRVESSTTVTEKKLDVVRLVASGGLVRNKTTQREVTTRADESEPVLFLFRRSGATPWILREQGTHYEALGVRLSPTAAPNFAATVAELRARAPRARYDERLVTRRGIASSQDLDLLAHLVARSA